MLPRFVVCQYNATWVLPEILNPGGATTEGSFGQQILNSAALTWFNTLHTGPVAYDRPRQPPGTFPFRWLVHKVSLGCKNNSGCDESFHGHQRLSMRSKSRNSTRRVVFLLFVTLFAIAYTHSSSIAPVHGATAQVHSPIAINGNQDFTLANGVIAGNGSAANPYIIADWNITTTGQNGHVALIGTTAHVIIRDVHASGGGNGFFLWNTANVVIENSSATYGDHGVSVSDSANITVANCVFDHNSVGIDAEPFQSSVSSTNSWYIGNTVTNSGNGVYIVTSVNMVFANNTVSANGTGVSITAVSSRIIGNNANNNNANGGYGMSVIGTNNLVSGNSVFSDQFGLIIGGSNNRVVSNAAFLDVSGIALGQYGTGFNTTISQNYVEQNSQYGIIVNSDSTGTNVTQNHVTNNQWSGIFLSGAISTTVIGNTVSKSGTGISVAYSTHTLIYHNNWIQNTVQADAAGNTGLSWNSSYPTGGNYWSDYTGIDQCSGPLQNNCSKPDGIGDTPYTLVPSGQNVTDSYPLMSSYGASQDTPPFWPAGSQATVSNLSFYSATVSWTPALDDTKVTGYQLYENGTSLARLSGSQRTYKVTGLVPGSVYLFQVQANDTASLKTDNGPSTMVIAPRTLPAPPPASSAEIIIRDSVSGDASYDPSSLTIQAGQTVDWCNIGLSSHTVSFNSSSNFFVGAGNCFFTLTFYSPGTFGYHDLYSGAAGTIIVQPVPTDFSLSADSSTVKPLPGQPGTSIITMTQAGGLTGTTNLSVRVSPHGLSCYLSTTQFYLGFSTLLGLSCQGPSGAYMVNVTATVGQLSHSLYLTYLIPGPQVSGKTPPTSTSLPRATPQSIVQVLTEMIILNWKQLVIGTVGVWAALVLTALGLVYRRGRRPRII